VATPANSRVPGRFARAVIENEPGTYLGTVLKDLMRYADPNVGAIKQWAGSGPETVSFEQGLVDPGTAHRLEQVMGGYWTDLTPHMRGVGILDTYQSVTRIWGVLWIALAVLAITGCALAAGPLRVAACLFGLSALAVYLVPAMTLSWDWRYGVPAQFELAAAAAVGAYGAWSRRRSVR